MQCMCISTFFVFQPFEHDLLEQVVVVVFVVNTFTVNLYGHVWTISSPNHTFPLKGYAVLGAHTFLSN